MRNNFYLSLLFLLFFNFNLLAEPFKFETTDIKIVDNGKFIYASEGKAISFDENLEIEAKKFEYNKELDILKANDNGTGLIKSENIKILFDEIIIDQKKLLIDAKGNVKIYDNIKGILIETDAITYDKGNNILKSINKSTLTDKIGNVFYVDSFIFEINNDLLKLKNAKFKDFDDNEFNTTLAYVNTKTNKLFGKDIEINLSNKTFNPNNEPRLKGKSIILDEEKNIREISKGVFTTCKKREGCPPWQLSSKKIKHDKENQLIFYDDALLKIYDIPVMYFPKFFHPDPTVKRKSGFLIPTIKNSPNSENYLNTPYFFAIAQNKDATFSPRFYTDNKILLQTEYRQVNYKSSHLSDFSVFKEKDVNSKNHFFYEFAKNFDFKRFKDSNLDFKIQKTSNDTYLRANKLKSVLIKDNEILENSFNLDLYSNDLSIDTKFIVYEDLDENHSDRYEYILPKLDLTKVIENKTNLNGEFSFKSSNMLRNYDTNVFEKININDLTFNSIPKINKLGFYNNYDFIIKNANTDTQNSENYKENVNYYLSGIFQYNSTLPLIKENQNYTNILKPKLSLKIAPNSTENIRNSDKRIDVNNIYSINRISTNDTIEGGLSLAYGNDFSIINKENAREIFGLKIANNIRLEENDDLPRNSQIGYKTSNIFSEITYSPNSFLNTKYNSSIKNNLTDVNYENFITEFKINNLVTSFDYLNENNTEKKNSYLTNTTKYIIDDSNSLSFSTRENKTSDLTEYYNLIYQYKNDCLAASIEYNKDYYNDRDIKPEESIFLKLTIIPFGETNSPNLKN